MLLRATALVAGGAALARDAGGRVVFIKGALPAETVWAEVTDERRDFANAVVSRVVEASPDRVSPPCSYVAAECGGCDFQHAVPQAQPTLKSAVVQDALRRLGGIDDARVDLAPTLPDRGFRSTVRCGVIGGRAGFRKAGTHEIVLVDYCLVAHPMINDLLERGRFTGADEVTLRVGVETGERLVIATPSASQVELPSDVESTTLVVGEDELADGKRAWYHEDVGGRRFRVSANSFFQTRTDGASALVDAVREVGGSQLASADHVLDAYGGVGLFGALAAPPSARLTHVESGRSAVSDARQNLAHRDAKILRIEVERWRPSPVDVVIADPARTGLGKRAVKVLAATNAKAIVLVSCDAASLGRDVRLLALHHYRLERAMLVDLFPHTHHVEVVSLFTLVGG